MDRSQQNFHNMTRTVLRTRIDHPTATSSPAALVRYFYRVGELEAVLNASRRALGIGLAPVTETKNLLKEPAVMAVGVAKNHFEKKICLIHQPLYQRAAHQL